MSNDRVIRKNPPDLRHPRSVLPIMDENLMPGSPDVYPARLKSGVRFIFVAGVP